MTCFSWLVTFHLCVTECAVYWGGLVRDQVLDVTPTFLTSNVQVDHVANQVSKAEMRYIDYDVWHKS